MIANNEMNEKMISPIMKAVTEQLIRLKKLEISQKSKFPSSRKNRKK